MRFHVIRERVGVNPAQLGPSAPPPEMVDNPVVGVKSHCRVKWMAYITLSYNGKRVFLALSTVEWIRGVVEAVSSGSGDPLSKREVKRIVKIATMLNLPGANLLSPITLCMRVNSLLKRLDSVVNGGDLDKNQVAIGGHADNLEKSVLRTALNSGVPALVDKAQSLIRLQEKRHNYDANLRLDKKAGQSVLSDLVLQDTLSGRGSVPRLKSLESYYLAIRDSLILEDESLDSEIKDYYRGMAQIAYALSKRSGDFKPDYMLLTCVGKLIGWTPAPGKPQQEKEYNTYLEWVTTQMRKAVVADKEAGNLQYQVTDVTLKELADCAADEEVDTDVDFNFEEEGASVEDSKFADYLMFSTSENIDLLGREDKAIVKKTSVMEGIKAKQLDRRWLSAFRLQFAEPFVSWNKQCVPTYKHVVTPHEMAYFRSLRDGVNIVWSVEEFEARKGVKLDGSRSGSPNTPGSVWSWVDLNPFAPFNGLGKNRWNYLACEKAGVNLKFQERYEVPGIEKQLEYVSGDGITKKEYPGNYFITALVDKTHDQSELLGEATLAGDGGYSFGKKMPSKSVKITTPLKAKQVVQHLPGNVSVTINGKEMPVQLVISNQRNRNIFESGFALDFQRMDRFTGGTPEKFRVGQTTKEDIEAYAKRFYVQLCKDGKPINVWAYLTIVKGYVVVDQDYGPSLSVPSLGYTSATHVLDFDGLMGWYWSLPLAKRDQARVSGSVKLAAGVKQLRGILDAVEKGGLTHTLPMPHLERGRSFQEQAAIQGLFGKSVATLFKALESNELGKVFDVCQKGVTLETPFGNATFQFVAVVSASDQYMVTPEVGTFKLLVKQMFELLYARSSNKAPNLFTYRVQCLRQVRKLADSLFERALRTGSDAIMHRRGHSMKARSLDGVGKKVLIPTSILAQYLGLKWDRDLRVWVDSCPDSEWAQQAQEQRAEQFGANAAEKMYSIFLGRAPSDKDVNRGLDKLQIQAFVLRHPMVGTMPLASYEVRSYLTTILVPAWVSDRYTGINSDGDGDLVEIIPVTRSVATSWEKRRALLDSQVAKG